MLKNTHSLKRAHAVWDLSVVPPETQLESSFNVHLELTGGGAPTSQTTVVPIQISSFATVKHLKIMLEPHAYHLYIKHVEQALDIGGRNVRYYARASSPVYRDGDGNDTDSDYNSEMEMSPRDDEPQGTRQELFLSSLKLSTSSGESMAKDTDALFLHKIQQDETIICRISLDQLIYE